jgi:tRNA threonylcarbamoyladenosine biosynthesis protein TsaE
MEYISNSVEETGEIARKIIENLNGQNIVLLQGELGAGKTTFSQNVLEFLGAKGPFTSPTFVIMKKYEVSELGFENVYHFDCYRIGEQDMLELGWKEIISDPNNLVLVEWPERIEKILPENSVRVSFEIKGEDERVLFFE